MSDHNPIDRVRNRTEAPQKFEDARETYTEKEAKLEREAPLDPPQPEEEGDFKERMQEKLRESSDSENSG